MVLHIARNSVFWPAALVSLAMASSTSAQVAEWDVRPPGSLVNRLSVLPNSPALVKSLGDAAEYVLRWKPPETADDWAKRRPEVERAFRAAIGLSTLPDRTPLNPRIVARHDFGEYVVENLVFESRPGFPVTANVYQPKSPIRGKRPTVLSPIGHFLGAGKAAGQVQERCIALARQGFLVLTYDAIGQGERMNLGNVHHEAGYALLPLGETIAGWMVWDSMRAVDYLLTRDDVDPERIAITGNSGGGLNALFTAALDTRIRAAVVVGFTFQFNNWLKYASAHCTCTHLPGAFRGMEWFEIAGLIAPRALMMLQGEYDSIFPIEGARRSAQDTATVYAVAGHPERVRFSEVPGQPHAYTRLYRERMYGWTALHLLGRGDGSPIPEVQIASLPESDRRLACDKDGSLMARAPSVIDLARAKALAVLNRPRQSAREWVLALAAPPEPLPHNLSPEIVRKESVEGGTLERVSFVSEEGAYIPGLLWLPDKPSPSAATVVIVHDRGKAAVAGSGLVEPLIQNGHIVLGLDLRGRGETLGRIRPNYDTNFRLVANSVLFGQPLAGRRAFDLIRGLDYLSRRQLAGQDIAVVGLGDDALPALLAAAADSRVRRIAVAGYFQTFVSQMRPAKARPLPDGWNDPQLQGRIDTGESEIDFGSVIPSALEHGDVADIAALIAPRRLLFCQARDNKSPGTTVFRSRFRRVLDSAGPNWADYDPDTPLDARKLLDWLERKGD